MRLSRYRSHILVSEANELEFESLKDALTFPVSENKQSVDLCVLSKNAFPSGLLPYVFKGARGAGLEIVVDDKRGDLPEPDRDAIASLTFKKGSTTHGLRPKQIEASWAAVCAQQAIIDSPTGSGKGNMVVACAAALPEIRWGIFAPTNDLIVDLGARFASAGIEVGYYTAAEQNPKQITICSYDKLSALRESDKEAYQELLSSFTGILVDECHTCGSRVRSRMLMQCINAGYRIGLSATPEDRTDGRTPICVGALGPIVYRVPRDELVEDDAIAQIDVFMVIHRHLEPEDRNSYTHFYKANIQNNNSRNRLVRALAEHAEKPAIVFATLTNHLHILHKKIESLNMNVEVAYGKTSAQKRKSIIQDTRNGMIDVIVGSKVFDTGIDIPNLMSAVIADAGSSAIKSAQKAGRIMRPKNGARAKLYDIYDVGFRNSEGKPSAFERQAIERMRTYLHKGFNVTIVEFDYETKTIRPYKK